MTTKVTATINGTSITMTVKSDDADVRTKVRNMLINVICTYGAAVSEMKVIEEA